MLTGWPTASVSTGLRSALGCIEKLTLAPDQFGSEDVLTLRRDGFADRAIADAIYICVGFNIINRVADALGVQVPPSKVFARGVKFALLFGYKMMSGLWIGRTASRDSSRLKMDEIQMRDNTVDDPYVCQVMCLKETVLASPGALDPAVREAACVAAELPDALAPYVKKVAQHAYKVTDHDMTVLHQAGYSDDQIFEVTVSAALGAGLVRLEAGMRALRDRP